MERFVDFLVRVIDELPKDAVTRTAGETKISDAVRAQIGRVIADLGPEERMVLIDTCQDGVNEWFEVASEADKLLAILIVITIAASLLRDSFGLPWGAPGDTSV